MKNVARPVSANRQSPGQRNMIKTQTGLTGFIGFTGSKTTAHLIGQVHEIWLLLGGHLVNRENPVNPVQENQDAIDCR